MIFNSTRCRKPTIPTQPVVIILGYTSSEVDFVEKTIPRFCVRSIPIYTYRPVAVSNSIGTFEYYAN